MIETAVAGAVGATAASAAASQAAAIAATSAAASPGFFAGIGLFLVGLVSAWGVLILGTLIVLGILFEHNGARGWAVFSAILLAATAYLFFSVPLITIAIGAAAYIVIGLVWSFWRYKRHADKVVAENRDATQSERDRALRKLHPREMLGTITAWVMIWPFSMVENIAGDLITLIQELISRVFRGIYYRIYDSAVSALK